MVSRMLEEGWMFAFPNGKVVTEFRVGDKWVREMFYPFVGDVTETEVSEYHNPEKVMKVQPNTHTRRTFYE